MFRSSAGRHSIELSCTIQCWNPLDTLGREQFSTRLGVVNDIHVIENTSFDDSHAIFAAECLSPSEQRGTTIRAEAGCDLLASIGRLANLFRCTLRNLEVGGRDDEIVGIVAPADLSAVGAVAERCHCRLA